MNTKRTFRFRMIIPAFPEDNIFNRVMNKTTALGPILVATSANKLQNWQVEVIDENNCRNAPRDNEGFVDHSILQREDRVDAVGFYCGLSSTMPRVWQLAGLYKTYGATTIAGGWHVIYAPEESLNKNIDVVVNGDGEEEIQYILLSLERGEKIRGEIKAKEVDLNYMPFPEFGLMRFARMKIYPIGRIRGCSMSCEFCSVKGRGRWASADYLIRQVKWHVETRRAKEFFIVDDRVEEDRNGTLEFFKKISRRYGNSLDITVQIRLGAARDTELLAAMKNAGVRRVCIGYESPIDEELNAMKKGISCSKMVELTKIYQKFGFLVHMMLIFGYPLLRLETAGTVVEPTEGLGAKEKEKRFKKFIKEAEPDSIQVLRPVPLLGSRLRDRLEKEGKLLPLEIVGWDKYDGNYVCFIPDDMAVRELQEYPAKIMYWFYNWTGWFKIPLRTLAMPFDYLIRGWHGWYKGWWNDVIKFGAHRLLTKAKRKGEQEKFIEKIIGRA